MIIILFLLALTALYFVIAPLYQGETFEPTASNASALDAFYQKKTHLLLAYQDLELDYNTHKISEADYAVQKRSLLEELHEVYKVLDATSKP